MGEKSESEKYVGDIGPQVKLLLLQGLKQHLLRNHFAPYFWQFPKSVEITWRMLVVLVIRRPVCSVNHLLRTPSSFDVCLCWLSRCREFVNSATLVCLTRMCVSLLCVICELNVILHMLLVLVSTNYSVVDIKSDWALTECFHRESLKFVPVSVIGCCYEVCRVIHLFHSSRCGLVEVCTKTYQLCCLDQQKLIVCYGDIAQCVCLLGYSSAK